MRMLEILALDNGAHANQTIDCDIPLPEGWAIIPDDMVCENFPFGTVEVIEVEGVPTVSKWIPGEIPAPEPEPEPEPTPQEDMDSMLVDHEYRITLLELGLTEEV